MKSTANIAELVQRIKKGDMLAAELLYEQYINAMYQISFRITNNALNTEDILQEAFAKSFIKLNSLKENNKYGGWLKRMVINASIDAVKKNKNWESLDNIPELSEPINNEPIPGLDPNKINVAIAKLPEKSRTVFTLHLMEGYTHNEIGNMLNIATSTSKSQYQYALKKLRKTLSKKS